MKTTPTPPPLLPPCVRSSVTARAIAVKIMRRGLVVVVRFGGQDISSHRLPLTGVDWYAASTLR